MQPDNQLVKRRLVILALLCFIALPLCVKFYSNRSNAFSDTTASTNALNFVDPTPLQNVVPEQSYRYVLDRLNEYVKNSGKNTSSMTIDGPVTIADGAYTFHVGFLPAGGTHIVSVRVINYDSVISTATYVDRVVQRVAVSTNKDGGTSSGFDNLVDVGFSSYQTQALQQAFDKFNSGSNVSIDTESISASTNPNNSSYTFTVTVGGTSYHAVVKTVGLTAVQLQLSDQKNGRQVFDSGTVNYTN